VLAPPSRQVAAAKSRFAAPRFMLSHVVPRFGLVVFLTVIMIVYRPIAFLPTFLAPHLPPAPVRPPPAEQSRASADQPMPALPQTANDAVQLNSCARDSEAVLACATAASDAGRGDRNSLNGWPPAFCGLKQF